MSCSFPVVSSCSSRWEQKAYFYRAHLSPPAGPVRRNQRRRSLGDLPLLPRQAGSALGEQGGHVSSACCVTPCTGCPQPRSVKVKALLGAHLFRAPKVTREGASAPEKRKQNLVACRRYVPLITALEDEVATKPLQVPFFFCFLFFPALERRGAPSEASHLIPALVGWGQVKDRNDLSSLQPSRFAKQPPGPCPLCASLSGKEHCRRSKIRLRK